MNLKQGDFARVGHHVCVVIAVEGDPSIPEDHLAVWYGETNSSGVPRVRTVPTEYVIPLEHPPEIYH